MQGDTRVEKYMGPVAAALDRSGLTGQARTDVYNRAYEAVWAAIRDRQITNADSLGMGARFRGEQP